jgi:hypothetical protein
VSGAIARLSPRSPSPCTAAFRTGSDASESADRSVVVAVLFSACANDRAAAARTLARGSSSNIFRARTDSRSWMSSIALRNQHPISITVVLWRGKSRILVKSSRAPSPAFRSLSISRVMSFPRAGPAFRIKSCTSLASDNSREDNLTGCTDTDNVARSTREARFVWHRA